MPLRRSSLVLAGVIAIAATTPGSASDTATGAIGGLAGLTGGFTLAAPRPVQPAYPAAATGPASAFVVQRPAAAFGDEVGTPARCWREVHYDDRTGSRVMRHCH
jgi:hypothetical protein